MKDVSMIGRRFGRLLVVANAGRHKTGGTAWTVRCDCGTEKALQGYEIRRGSARSCGCLRREVLLRVKHGGCVRGASITYISFRRMVKRCHDPRDEDYADYGAVGVSVCAEWRRDYAAFLRSVGPRPSKQHSLDRYPNGVGNYEPGNVRWATVSQQNRNRQKYNVFVVIDGKKRLLVDACDNLGIPHKRARDRIEDGWSPEEALEIVDRPSRRKTSALPKDKNFNRSAP